MALLVAVATGHAQQANTPRAGYVYPGGGQRGATVQVSVGGQFLDGVTAAMVSGTGVSARVVGFDKPLTQQQITDLRDRAQALQKNASDPAVRKQIDDARMQIGAALRRNANPALAEIVTLEITLGADAELGLRQLRLVTPLGLTNPLNLAVGDLPEAREKDDKNGPADAELTVSLPVTVNGRLIPGDIDRRQAPLRQPNQYMPGDIDRYRFHAAKGEDLVVAVSARALLPYLADAVPGWIQPVVTLYDAGGHELAYEDDYRSHPDPVLHYRVPADGDYVVTIADALFRGREDFVYRLTIGDIPFVTDVFPLGARAGANTRVELRGWNLPVTAMTINSLDWAPGFHEIGVPGGPFASNRMPFAVDDLPEAIEREPNNSAARPQSVTLPVMVNGRIQVAGDFDVFSFAGRAGDLVAAEVYARRLESPLDSTLELMDAAGKRVAFDDDRVDRGAGLLTHHADSGILATLPATGTYFVRLGDAQGKGGPAFAYRLRLSAAMPDFDLRVSPSTINATAGAALPLTVVAIRKDGFAGDIALTLKNAPGYTLSGAVVPAGQDQIRMTLTAPGNAVRGPIDLHIEGRATIGGGLVAHDAVGADDMMQAFAYHQFVTADQLRVVTSGRGGARLPAKLLGEQPVRIPAGGAAHVRLSLPPAYATFDHLEFALDDPPEGITLGDLTLTPGTAEFVLHAGAKVPAGARGNLIVTVSGERVPAPNAPAPQARRRVVLGLLPAIAFEIAPGVTLSPHEPGAPDVADPRSRKNRVLPREGVRVFPRSDPGQYSVRDGLAQYRPRPADARLLRRTI